MTSVPELSTSFRILVVDDDPVVCATVEHVLRRAGHLVQTALSGSQALRLAAGQAFDLVITDLVMPEQDGTAIISKFKEMFPGMPLVAMSGGARLGTPDTLISAREAGADGLLRKPFTAETLAGTINAVLAKRGASIL